MDLCAFASSQAHGNVLSNHLCWTNEINKFLPATWREGIFGITKSKNRKKSQLVPPEQKNINMMNDILTKFEEARELVMEKFVKEFVIGKMYLKVRYYSLIVECEIDAQCYETPSKGFLKA